MRHLEKKMSARWKLFVLSLGTCLAMTAQATEIDFSSQRDFEEINLNIRDQGRVDSAFVVLSVKLAAPARRRLEVATRNALQQDLTLSLDGTPISTSTVQSVVKGPRLQIVLSRQIARDVFPSL